MYEAYYDDVKDICVKNTLTGQAEWVRVFNRWTYFNPDKTYSQTLSKMLKHHKYADSVFTFIDSHEDFNELIKVLKLMSLLED